MRKRKLALIVPVIAALLLAFPTAAAGSGSVAVTVDGIAVRDGGLSYVEDGTAWLPLRAVSEALGADTVIWDPNTACAEIEAPSLALSVTVGECYLIANGRYLYIEGGCRISDGRIMVPARTLGKAFGASVEWDGITRTVRIRTGGTPITPGSKYYGKTDLYWLSRIIHAEARGESLTGQIAVGNVVLNRVADDDFPSTVKSVIFDKRCGIQFSPAYSGSINNTPYESCITAAKLALDGANVVGESLYFSPARSADTCWAGRNCEFVAQIGNHVFFA